MTTLFKNGNVLSPDCQTFTKTDLLIEDEKIIAIGEAATADNIVDATGAFIMPGLIDIHNHGSIGVYYATCDQPMEPALLYAAGQGVTTLLPSIGTRSAEDVIKGIRLVVETKKRGVRGSNIGGIHLEGPFISEEKKGAMMRKSPACNVETFLSFLEAGEGEIKLMAIAPERENALDVIREGVKRGVRMSLGHTNATYDQAMAAIDAGASHATHTFNAMRSYNHREPGVLGAVLTSPSVMCEAICDMVHLAPATVKLIRGMKGIEGMILISDSVAVTGMPDGEYGVDNNTRFVKDGVCRLQNGTIAGSCFSMADGARKLVNMLGFTLPEIAQIGSLNPARAIGLDSITGTLEVGKRADIILCDERMNVSRVFVSGRETELSRPGVRF